MKKLISSVLAGVMAVSMTVMASAAPEPVEPPEKASYTATKTNTAITIDGQMDDAYKNAEVVKLESKIMIDLLASEEDIATGEMRILWDDSAVYVYVLVNDATYAPAYKDPSWWNNCDSVWLGMGVGGELTKANCYAFSRMNTTGFELVGGLKYRAMFEDCAAAEVAAVNLKDGKVVNMVSYGNADGNYPANALKPEGDVDSYALEIKIPYTGAKVGGTEYFGAFISDDINFAGIDLVNNAEGRSRTSEAVSTESDNGIWQRSGELVEGDGTIAGDASPYYDTLTFRDIPAGGDDNQGDNQDDGKDDGNTKPGESPETGVAVSVSAVVLGVTGAAALLVFRKKSR